MNSDGWLCVARYLTVRELCALMQVSHEWFYLWVTDRMWAYQKHRILSEFPALQALQMMRQNTLRVALLKVTATRNVKRLGLCRDAGFGTSLGDG